MHTSQIASRIPNTSWTLIVRAQRGGDDLETLLKTYRWPVYAYLRRAKGRTSSDADDLTQGFLWDVLLNRDLLERADKNRGRFRTYLFAALENYLTDAHRHEHGRDGNRPKTFAVEDVTMFAQAEPLDEDDPAEAFKRQWATTVFDLALKHVEEECREDGMEVQWTAFVERLLRPAQHHCESTPVDQLQARFAIERRSQVDSMLQTISRKVKQACRAIILQTVDDPADVEAELAELRKYLPM